MIDPRPDDAHGSLIALEAATRRYRGGDGLRGVTLAVQPGQVHAIVGMNGAGKSTLIRLVLGMTDPDEGTVAVLGVPVRRATAHEWALVGHATDDAGGYPELTVRENLAVAARLHLVPPRLVAAAVTRAVDEFGLGEFADRPLRRLSRGNRQRAGLAASTTHGPRILVWDEPTATLDPAGVLLAREALLRRVADGGGALVSSHHLDEMARVADTITVLNRGRVIGSLDPGGADLERAFFALVHADSRERA